MKLVTKLKVLGVATAFAGAVGFLVSRFGGQVQQKLKEAKKRRELQEELSRVLGEKARIEEALRQLDEPAETHQAKEDDERE